MQSFSVETTNINTPGIKKHFNKYKKTPERAIIELVANGFDAHADIVNIYTEGDVGTSKVVVSDNGDGIDPLLKHKHFSCFNDSQKVGDDDTQGAHGRGRLAFHMLCNNAEWFSLSNGKNIKISIDATELERYTLSNLDPHEQKKEILVNNKGTYVELFNFHTNR